MTWNWLRIDLTQAGNPDRAQVSYGPGGLIYEAARLDVQEILDELTGQDPGFRGANQSWRRGEDFVMAMGSQVWSVFEENPGEPSGTTARRLAEKLVTRLHSADRDTADAGDNIPGAGAGLGEMAAGGLAADGLSGGVVRLHTGEVTAEPVLLIVSVALRRLREDGLNGMLAFADVVALARDPAFVVPDTSQTRAFQEGLLDEGGRMERGIAAVVRASAADEGPGVRALDPITGWSPVE